MVTNAPLEGNTPLATTRGIADPNYVEPLSPTQPRFYTHWSSIFAGIFVALSTMAILSALGIAIGVSRYYAGSDARFWGTGAGWWAFVAALISFCVGGYVAARTSTFNYSNKGVYHGFMVWAVAIPLLAFLGSSLYQMSAGASDVTLTRNQGTTVTPDNSAVVTNTGESVRARVTAGQAWGGFFALLLGLGAATFGGYLGSMRVTTPRAVRTQSGVGSTVIP
ncbi:MAG TPA: hypothetical protein VHM90_16780 [Phycisphaerae bacterium]|jgi:hypothetical protein|nr:hypothetical protein [Phycisphaerae bacterium]